MLFCPRLRFLIVYGDLIVIQRISVVEVYVSKVRKKLKGTTFAENLQTLRSVGYILKMFSKLKKHGMRMILVILFATLVSSL